MSPLCGHILAAADFDVFGVGIPAVSKHIANIYEQGELEPEATVSKMEIVRLEGGRQVRRQVDHGSWQP